MGISIILGPIYICIEPSPCNMARRSVKLSALQCAALLALQVPPLLCPGWNMHARGI